MNEGDILAFLFVLLMFVGIGFVWLIALSVRLHHLTKMVLDCAACLKSQGEGNKVQLEINENVLQRVGALEKRQRVSR